MRTRHFQLSSRLQGSRLVQSGHVVSLGEGAQQSWVTITRTGSFSDPRYGRFEITPAMLGEMVRNFDARVYGQDIFLDVAHRPDQGAAAKVLKLTVDSNRLRALVEWTPYGVEAVKDRGYQYLSAEFHEKFQDNESGQQHGCVLLGAGLTVRPGIKRLDPVRLSLDAGVDAPVLFLDQFQSTLLSETKTMWAQLLKELSEKLGSLKLAQAVIDSLIDAATKSLANVTDQAAATALIASFETAGKQLAEKLGEQPAAINLSIAAPANIDTAVAAAVAKNLSERDTAAKQLAEGLEASRKLLSETIGAAAGLDDAAKKLLAEKALPLINTGMTADQVKALAQLQIEAGQREAAARQLSAMGYRISGNPHITVDSSNEAKALQEQMDKRLSSDSDAVRFAKTGGTLQAANKAAAEKVLAEFDRENGHRLHEEHKLLSGGTGSVSDLKLPAIFERTVIREALYSLIGLSFVDFNTAQFANSVLIPFSSRDTTAAGVKAVRVYEGQGIPRAGIKQDYETAYPIPQKLAFLISKEMRMLSQNGQIDFDVLAENVRNATRIVGEDTDTLIFNEILNATDEFGAVAVSNEALTQVNGTNKIFVLAQFPVVRPRAYFDLKGTQVGSTVNPITVTYGGTPIVAWDGSGTQSAGTYWVINWNLGEIYFVNAAGAIQTPPNATAISVSYGYATNVAKFDTDLGSMTLGEKWDDFLYRFSLRKNVVEDQRYYTADLALMSGTVQTSVSQADQFMAAYSKPGSDLTADGNLGRLKGVPAFKTSAPGILMGDQRVLVGQRNQTRLRMLKPWAMDELTSARNSNGLFTAQDETYGTQWLALHTPSPLKNALTSVALYSSSARINRAA